MSDVKRINLHKVPWLSFCYTSLDLQMKSKHFKLEINMLAQTLHSLHSLAVL